MFSALLIDLDDTLLDDRGSMATAVLQFRHKHGLAPHLDDESLVARWDEVGRALWRRLALGEVTVQEQRRLRLRQVLLPGASDEDADDLFADYLTFYEDSWSLLPGANDFLVATAHIPRLILTNGHRPQAQRKLEKCGLMNLVSGLVTPDDCGFRKPDPRIFTYALNLLGVQASEVLMVGDNLEADIEPALALGMKAFHVNPFELGRSIRHAAGAP